MEAFEKELTELINRHSIENVVDMPDFLLAGMICRMIEAMGPSIKKTLDWHGCDSVCHPSPNVQISGLSAESDCYPNTRQEIGKMMNEEKIEEPTVAEDHQTKRSNFRQELESLINGHSMENGSDTPDFLLAEYLSRSLELFDVIVERREQWYGRSTCPAGDNKILTNSRRKNRKLNQERKNEQTRQHDRR
jgi:hypothetical protein